MNFLVFNRLGILTDEVSQNLVEALDWVVNNDLKHVELRTFDGMNISDVTDETLDKVMGEIEKRNIFVSGVASPVFKCALDPTRPVASGDTFGQAEESVEAHFQKLDRMIEISKRLKTNKIRIFSFWREETPEKYEDEIVGHLKKAAKRAEEENILLLLENEVACNGGYASEVARIVEKVNSPNLKALWDPGNEEYGGRSSYPEGYENVKSVIGHIHLKDAYIQENGEPKCVPIGEGNVPYLDQLQALEESQYTGLFTIETHYVPVSGTPMEGSNRTLIGLQNIIKKMRNLT